MGEEEVRSPGADTSSSAAHVHLEGMHAADGLTSRAACGHGTSLVAERQEGVDVAAEEGRSSLRHRRLAQLDL